MYSGLLGLYGSLADPTGQTLNPLAAAIRELFGVNASNQIRTLTAGQPTPQTPTGATLRNLNVSDQFSVPPVGSSGNPTQGAINTAANAAVPLPQLPSMPQSQPIDQAPAHPRGLFAPEFIHGLNQRALLGAAQGLLASSGASRLPVTMGAALANALNTSTTGTDNLVSGALRAGMGTDLLNTMQTKADTSQDAQSVKDWRQDVRSQAYEMMQSGVITPTQYAQILSSTGDTTATRAVVNPPPSRPPPTRRIQVGNNIVTQQWDPRSNQYVNVGTGPKYAPSTNQTEAYVMNKVRAGKPLSPGEQKIWDRMQKSASSIDALIHTATSAPATPANPQTTNTNQAALIAQAKAAIAQGASAAQVAARLKAMGINPAAAGIQ